MAALNGVLLYGVFTKGWGLHRSAAEARGEEIVGEVIFLWQDVDQQKRARLLRDLARVAERLGLNTLDRGHLDTVFAGASVQFLSIERRSWRRIGLL